MSGHWQRVPLSPLGEGDSWCGRQLQSLWHFRCLLCTCVLWCGCPGAHADVPTGRPSLMLGEGRAGVFSLLRPGLPDTGCAGAPGKLAWPNGASCSLLYSCLPRTAFLLFKVLNNHPKEDNIL